MQRNILKISFLIFSLTFFTSCSGVQGIGVSVLKTLGLVPGTSMVDSSDSMINAAKNMSREEEYYLGRAVAARILEAYKPYNNAKVQEYVSLVGHALASYSDKPDTFGGYHFLVLDSDEINAMAAPGGFIFLTRGLLDLMPDEDTLASVLAHEITHVEERHGVEAISQADLTKTLSSLGQIAGSLNCGELISQASLVFGGAVDDVFNSLVTKGYSRDQEFKADVGAIKILYRAGYNPHAMLVMLDEVAKAEKEKQGGWFDTHPEASDRKDRVESNLNNNSIPVVEKGRVIRAKRFFNIVRG
ncbi:MAG: M48 family metalloprotease [Bdellovibrionales bacterium]|nr:M48 family metalloprotease [Bdellovibrionales bacterium]